MSVFEKGSYSEEFKKKNSRLEYLNTSVIFQSSSPINNGEIRDQFAITKDPSYILMKHIAELYGGSVSTHSDSDGISMV